MGRGHHHASGHGHGHEHEHGHGHAASGSGPRRLLGWLRPHAHDVSDQIDSALERSDRGIRATQLTLAVLLATSALQLVIAIVSGSVALLADMVHNVADALTSIPLWIAFVLGRRLPTRRYPYGYRRAEDLVGVVIVAAIAVSAVLVGWHSIERLVALEPIAHPGWVLLAGAVGVAGNEVAATVRIRVGRGIGSAALVADGYHARTDTLASFGVIVAAVASWLGAPIVDPLVGLVITGLIGWILVLTARQVLRRLMDAVEPEVIGTMEQVAAGVDGVRAVDWARARWVGHRLSGELAVTVDADLTVADGHEVSEEVHHALLHALPHLEEATVHLNPGVDELAADPHHRTRHHRDEEQGG
jgi:cation diffusion facilitator family transporter